VAAKLTRLTHKTVTQLQLVAQSYTTFALLAPGGHLDTPSYMIILGEMKITGEKYILSSLTL